ncbi:MAG TPA: N-acetyl-gamma-glutamyl-phosphate reductase [Solirubrobacteraceae bacterium]|jgi:N-acetyl-gamma-glutamyl-phosphate reductase common form|nr:N-acetyl-gamma-glutamyl-phosphate reductase [Solirubrobacteraceae bacterium]
MSGIRVGIHGASGPVGRELCRLLLGHPAVATIIPASRGAEPLERVHRNLLGSGLTFSDPQMLLESADELDVVFVASPAGEAMELAPRMLAAGVRVIDLGGDFRFADPTLYERVYHIAHSAPQLLERAVYGVTELERDRVARSDLIANPGCYAITAILALAPLLAEHAPDSISIHAINGTTGAGTTPRREVMHAAAAGDMLPYNLDAHRHAPELEDQLGRLADRPVQVELSTAHGPFARGIYLLASLPAADGRCATISREALTDLYHNRYGRGDTGEFFVRINDHPRRLSGNAKEYDIYPSMASVTGSNFCHIGLDYDAGRGVIKVVAVTDNLVKGAAGSAIQNMNVMLALDEREGISHYGL